MNSLIKFYFVYFYFLVVVFLPLQKCEMIFKYNNNVERNAEICMCSESQKKLYIFLHKIKSISVMNMKMELQHFNEKYKINGFVSVYQGQV